MKVSRQLTLTFTLFALLACVAARSVPSKPATGRRTFGNFQPLSYKNAFTIRDSSDQTSKLTGDVVQAATKFFAANGNVEEEEVKVLSFLTSKHNGVTHVYFQQQLNGIPVANAFGNINILKSGEVHSIGDSFYTGEKPKTSEFRPKYSAKDAVKALANLLEIQETLNLAESPVRSHSIRKETTVTGVTFAQADVQTELNYLHTENGIRLVRKLMVDMNKNYYEACIDTESNTVLSLIDFVADATYNVLPFGINDLGGGDLRIVPNPEDDVASRDGWHISGGEIYTDTIGNNVIAQENWDGNAQYHSEFRPKGEIRIIGGLRFDFPFDQTKNPRESISASVTQLFYMNNKIHDVFYHYGFDEEAGNFQEYNFNLGGEGGDGVIANTQDGSGTNNAAFGTLPDGMNGRMYMFLMDENPEDQPDLQLRDSSFDNGIVIHEYLHGISNRLTGGRLNTRCLPGGESGGMGEGWGDIFSVMFQCNNETTRDEVFKIGAFSFAARPNGIRNFPYSTSFDINPSTYSFTALPDYTSVHRKGEVWASILNEVYWNLVEKHGFQDDWYITNRQDAPDGRLGGNVIFAQLLIDGMKFQPCLPNFIQARNAIFAADLINNLGANFKELWKGFAKRGLGVNAVFPGIENFDVPDDTQ